MASKVMELLLLGRHTRTKRIEAEGRRKKEEEEGEGIRRTRYVKLIGEERCAKGRERGGRGAFLMAPAGPREEAVRREKLLIDLLR